MDHLLKEINKAKERFNLDDDLRIVSCYEAGRDGFWGVAAHYHGRKRPFNNFKAIRAKPPGRTLKY